MKKILVLMSLVISDVTSASIYFGVCYPGGKAYSLQDGQREVVNVYSIEVEKTSLGFKLNPTFIIDNSSEQNCLRNECTTLQGHEYAKSQDALEAESMQEIKSHLEQRACRGSRFSIFQAIYE